MNKKVIYEFGLFLTEYGTESHALGSTESIDDDFLKITVWVGSLAKDQIDINDFDSLIDGINFVTLVETVCSNNIDDWGSPNPLCRYGDYSHCGTCPYEGTLRAMGEPFEIKRKYVYGTTDIDIKNYSILDDDWVGVKHMRTSIKNKIKRRKENAVLLYRM